MLLPSLGKGGIKHFWWASDPSPSAEASSYAEKGHRADVVASTTRGWNRSLHGLPVLVPVSGANPS